MESLRPDEAAVLRAYADKGVLVLHEQTHVYIPSEPEIGFRLRAPGACGRPPADGSEEETARGEVGPTATF